MSDDSQDEIFDSESDSPVIRNSNLTPEQIDEEARAEEEFISAPEDTVINPLVPAWSQELDNNLEGAISSGTLDDMNKILINNEGNMLDNNEANPAAPAAEPTPVLGAKKAKETPAPAPAAAPVPAVPVAAPAAPAAAGASKKKGKGGLIALIIILVLLVVGGIVAAVLFIFVFNGGNDIDKAIAGTLKSESIQVKGEFKTTGGENKKDSSSTESYAINMSAKSGTFEGVISDGKISGSTNLKMENGSGSSSDMKVDFAYDKSGVYFKTNDLSSSFGSMASFFENKWFLVDPSFMSQNNTTGCSDPFGVISTVLSKDTLADFAKSYESKPFIEIDKDAKEEEINGLKYYKVKANAEKAKEFANSVKDSDSVKKIQACSSSSSDSNDSNSSSKPEVMLAVKSGKIAGMKVVTKNGDETTTVTMTFEYEKKEASIPSDATSLTSLMQMFMGGSSSSYGGSSLSPYSSSLNSGSSSWSLLDDDDDDDDDDYSSLYKSLLDDDDEDDDDDDTSDYSDLLEQLLN